MITSNDFKRIKNDYFGNPRYVVHFLSLGVNYNEALQLARKIGGRKYRGKDFGGGIVFQSYNLDALSASLNEALKKQQQQR